MVVLRRRDEQCIGRSDGALERHDGRRLTGVLDVLVIHGDVSEIEDIDADSRRGGLRRGAHQSTVVGSSTEATGETQDLDVVHDLALLSLVPAWTCVFAARTNMSNSTHGATVSR